LFSALDERQAVARGRGRNARDFELHVVAVEGRAYRRGREWTWVQAHQVARSRTRDPVRGSQLYAEKCGACHGIDGQGQNAADGTCLFPALWGPKSFNIGAGMARLSNAAAFTKSNMPLGSGDSLSDHDAIDIAAYFTRQPRPDFAAKSQDWPKGDKPADAPY
jgi:thiosulfate dehydrogenase